MFACSYSHCCQRARMRNPYVPGSGHLKRVHSSYLISNVPKTSYTIIYRHCALDGTSDWSSLSTAVGLVEIYLRSNGHKTILVELRALLEKNTITCNTNINNVLHTRHHASQIVTVTNRDVISTHCSRLNKHLRESACSEYFKQ